MLEAVDNFIMNHDASTFNYKIVSASVGAKQPKQQRAVAMALAEKAFDGDILEVAPGKYKKPVRNTQATGYFVRRSNGKNSVVTDQDGEELMVAERNSMHALNGDRVAVTVAARMKGQQSEAIVTEILEKKPQTFIGVIKSYKSVYCLHTDSKYIASDIIIPKGKLRGAKDGDKVVARITSWPEDANNPKGEVIDVLGKKGENDTEIHAILAEFGLPYEYPEKLEAEANKIDAGITPEVIAAREDFRKVTTFTIDPKDAKDFDDALSIRRLKNGHYEVGVHIADVTHYVTPDSALNKEAEKRATSVYLVDRVVPMLPEHLSNGICSLRPNEEKLTFSTIFEMDEEGKVLDARIARTVIKSDRRFTYEEAQEIIETGKGDLAKEVLALDKLAKILRKKRYENGSVEFDRVEVRFDIDEKGHPVAVYFKESKDANKLIEEFMLLANKTVALSIGKPGTLPGKEGYGKTCNTPENEAAKKSKKTKSKAFVYRVHDMPDPAKLNDLATLSRTFGYKIKSEGSPREVNRSINAMLSDVKGKGEENFLSTLAIRSMAKAVYTTNNIGHYGLGFDYYTHFTSPIRRYPDMMVHRLLDRYLHGARSVNVEKLEEECKHSSDMEQLAANAERASIKYKQVEFMADRMGQVFKGMISGVTEWGLYVELEENKCEGLVPMRELDDDYYDFDEKNFCLVGRKHNNRYRLGDEVTVQVARCDIDKKQLDFVILDEKNPPRSLDNPKGEKAAKDALRSGGKPKTAGKKRKSDRSDKSRSSRKTPKSKKH